LEKVGYGRLVLDSRNEAASDLSSPGMEDLREVDERAVVGSAGSLVEVFLLFVLFVFLDDFLSSRFSLTGNMAKSCRPKGVKSSVTWTREGKVILFWSPIILALKQGRDWSLKVAAGTNPAFRVWGKKG
jgi:hypothetical protein